MAKQAPSERTIVRRILDESKRLGWWCVKMHGNQYMMKGLPDILAIRGGRCVWMEAKRPGQEPTKIQLHVMRQLAAAGCPVAVVHSAADARHFLEAIG